MNASDYLRTRFQSDRQLAIYAKNGFTNTMQAAKGIASDIYSGLERASWYSSCFIPRYNDVCQELMAEEIRTAYSIQSIFRYHDVLGHMLYLYFQTVCKDVKEGNKEGSAQKLVRDVAHLTAHFTVAGGTRFAVASAIAVTIAKSELLSKVVAQKVAGKMPVGVYLIQVFGIQQKAAMAARALKAINPNYYWILYQAKLEMLYYFVEPVLSEITGNVNAGVYSTLDQLAGHIREKFSV
jgi:hypothetical protein